jgi:phasin family protein
MTEAQDRAKLAFEKSQALFGEAGEFTKGNVEALVESGKILAAGLQDMGKDYVAEGKTALETVQADIKELAAVKSPADFFKLQGEILRRNFDAAVATGSKRSEAALKLAGDAFAPLSTRVSLAVEKVKQAA